MATLGSVWRPPPCRSSGWKKKEQNKLWTWDSWIIYKNAIRLIDPLTLHKNKFSQIGVNSVWGTLKSRKLGGTYQISSHNIIYIFFLNLSQAVKAAVNNKKMSWSMKSSTQHVFLCMEPEAKQEHFLCGSNTVYIWISCPSYAG